MDGLQVFIRDNPMKMDDLESPKSMETPIYSMYRCLSPKLIRTHVGVCAACQQPTVFSISRTWQYEYPLSIWVPRNGNICDLKGGNTC